MSHTYLFQSSRLGFRNWVAEDLPKMAAINADKEVMEFFPSTSTTAETAAFIERMQTMFAEKGYCYFAVEELDSSEFIGFIGLCEQTFEAEFTPCVDIGWRLDKAFWNKGYATEGAKKCLEYAFEVLKLAKIYAFAPIVNEKSIKVMEKIEMKKQLYFLHPKLVHDKRLEKCVCYSVKNNQDENYT